MPTNHSRVLALGAAVAGACLVGCDEGEAIRVYQAPKDAPPVVRPPAPTANAPAGKPLTWTLPPGWSEVPSAGGEQFGRFATLQASADDPTLQLTINRIGGTGAGDLLPNLNRWEGQLGQQPTPAAELDKKSKKIAIDGHDAFRVDIAGTDPKTQAPARMLGVIAPHGDESWSFKFQGPPDKIAAQEAAFDAFVASVKFTTHDHGEDPHAGHDHDAHAGHDHGAASSQPTLPPQDNKSYALAGVTTPPGWERDNTERPMRVATFFVGQGNDRAELMVTKFAVDRFGSLLQNVNRWRGEVGLPEAKDEFGENFRQLTTPHGPAFAFDFVGPDSPVPGAPVKRSYVTMLRKGGEMWFVKLIGPAKTVGEQRENYEALIQSLQFGEAQ